MTNSIFVYGTLHPDRAPAEVLHLVKRFRPQGEGTVRGVVRDLGEYPGLVLTERRGATVHGHVFGLPDDPDVLPALDSYEGFVPEDPGASLFLRMRRMVTITDGSRMRCWAYMYNEAVSIPPGTRY